MIYVLVTYKRNNSDKIDFGKEVAGAVYAFSTTPNGEELVPAPNANQETGLFASATPLLQATSETHGQALLEPSGHHGRPRHARSDDPRPGRPGRRGGQGDARGAASASAKKACSEPPTSTRNPRPSAKPPTPRWSPAKGTVFFEDADEILQIPSDFKSAPKTLFRFEEPESFVEGPFKGELATFGENTAESFYGGGLAIQPEGAESEGRLVADAEVHEVQTGGVLGPLSTAALSFHYNEEAGGTVSVKENGWTGGKAGELGSAEELRDRLRRQLPAGRGRHLEQGVRAGPLDQRSDRVRALRTHALARPPEKAARWKPCWPAKNSAASAPPAPSRWRLRSRRAMSSACSGSSAPKAKKRSPRRGEQTQTAEVAHKFAKTGKVTVEAIIHTDDLATPVLPAVKLTLNVEAPTGVPKVTGQPTSQTVGGRPAGDVQSHRDGEPTPTVQWEVSTDGGKTWTAVGAGTEGGTTETLTVTGTEQLRERLRVPRGLQELAGRNAGLQQRRHAHRRNQIGARSQRKSRTRSQRKSRTRSQRKKPKDAKPKKKPRRRHRRRHRKKRRRQQLQRQQERPRKKRNERAKTTVTPPPAEAAAAVKATSASTVSSSGSLTVKLSCPAGVSICSGTITLKTASAVSASARQAKASVLTLASARFSIAGGQTKAVTLHLSSAARKLLTRSHSLRTRATIAATNGSGAASSGQALLTLKAAKH